MGLRRPGARLSQSQRIHYRPGSRTKRDRAQKALERALALASEIDEQGAKIPMILDSLAELLMLRGDREGARNYLERAVKISDEHGNKWYAWQPVRSLARYHLMMSEAQL